ncbi:cell surface protein [Candidatus Sumerlaeota bacterium]|nr:cell surface protein [Candidatus Sumerlaeota bacterium]
MKRIGQIIIFAVFMVMSLFSPALAYDPFADEVTSVTYGVGAGFGQEYFPDNVLGPPHGNADAHMPQTSPEHLLSLGNGGRIVLKFGDNIVVDGDGVDLAVFENPLIQIGDTEYSFCESAVVAVSQDGRTFYTFPYDFIPPPPGGRLGKMSDYIGFAGIHPVYSNPANGIDPLDPEVSGGDFFDLADVGLRWAQYVKIIDTGVPGTSSQMTDPDGDVIDDPGNLYNDPSIRKLGFDLDAVAAIHWQPITTAKNWYLYE